MKYQIGELVRFRLTYGISALGIIVKRYHDTKTYDVEPIRQEDKKHKEAWYADHEISKV